MPLTYSVRKPAFGTRSTVRCEFRCVLSHGVSSHLTPRLASSTKKDRIQFFGFLLGVIGSFPACALVGGGRFCLVLDLRPTTGWTQGLAPAADGHQSTTSSRAHSKFVKEEIIMAFLNEWVFALKFVPLYKLQPEQSQFWFIGQAFKVVSLLSLLIKGAKKELFCYCSVATLQSI